MIHNYLAGVLYANIATPVLPLATPKSAVLKKLPPSGLQLSRKGTRSFPAPDFNFPVRGLGVCLRLAFSCTEVRAELYEGQGCEGVYRQ